MEKIKNYALVILCAVVIVMGCIMGAAFRAKNVYKRNYIASQDTLRTYEIKNGELLVAKKAYELSNRNLSDALSSTRKELKDIEQKLKSKIDYIAEIEGNVRIDTVTTTIVRDSISYVIRDGIYPFYYSDNYFSFEGQTNTHENKTFLYNLKMDLPLTVGLTKDNQIFVNTSNPYVTITDIKGAKVKPKHKHFSHGIQLGIGPAYSFIYNRFDFAIYAGYGLEYRF